jgi:hypothetical protein
MTNQKFLFLRSGHATSPFFFAGLFFTFLVIIIASLLFVRRLFFGCIALHDAPFCVTVQNWCTLYYVIELNCYFGLFVTRMCLLKVNFMNTEE